MKAERLAQRHWQALSQFLGKERDPAPPRMVKAREKLTRLSSTQFSELSTDVYDEVLRRRFAAQGGPGPAALEPEAAFHPKRNQAREKLSSLALTRFRDLASDVYYEIGRRFPSIARAAEGTASIPSSSMPTSPVASDRVKPNIRNTTFIPNKSAMVEDDEEEDLEVPEPSAKRYVDHDGASTKSSEYGKPVLQSHTMNGSNTLSADHSSEIRIKELEHKLARIEIKAQEATAQAAGRVELEAALQEALERNDKLEEQVKQLKAQATQSTAQAEELTRAKASLAGQQNVEQEMREALDKLMLELSQMSNRETSMQQQLERLQEELAEQKKQTSSWQAQYQKSKLALRQVKVTSAFFAPGGGLPGDGTLNGAAVVAAAGLISTTGTIQDTSFAQFQGAIDELLRFARSQPQQVLNPMRAIVTATKAIQNDIRNSDFEQRDERVGKLMVRLSSTANNLMIACRNHVGSAGLSPVSLVDAAASHLTSTVIELAKICKIQSLPEKTEARPASLSQTPPVMQQDEEDELPFTPHPLSETPGSAFLSVNSQRQQGRPPSQQTPVRPQPPAQQEKRSQPQAHQPQPGSDTMSPAKRNSLQDLKLSLEAQTEGIVTAIQKLLAAIRANQKPAVLQQYIGDIVVSVTSATTLLQPAFLSSEASRTLRQGCQGIGVALETCCTRLRHMENGAAEEPAEAASKDFKQRLAGVAFDTAKQTKELSIALERFQMTLDKGFDEPDLT
jgi:hypothetical protein